MMAEVGASISRIPGPPFGPSYRITTTSPGLISPDRIASQTTLLRIEDARRAGDPRALDARDFRHRAFGRQVAAQDGEVALL